MGDGALRKLFFIEDCVQQNTNGALTAKQEFTRYQNKI